MANKQILLTVFRDKAAPFNPTTGVTSYSPPLGRSINVDGINSINAYTENSVVYTSLMYHETPGGVREQIISPIASGTIIGLCNA